MNPYLSFGLAMCAIVLLSLGLTAYLAVYFNRRAREDLAAALAPLAELLDGSVDLDDAGVRGRFAGHIASASVVQGPAGAGRYLATSLIDGAGGERWSWTARLAKKAGAEREIEFDAAPDLASELRPPLEGLTGRRLTEPGWFRVEYDPGPGHVQYTRPMRTRRDLPGAEAFRTLLEDLVLLADANRRIQQPTEEPPVS
jgi:hypothetical protein